MQGLADGYFVLPSTIGDYLAGLLGTEPVPTDDPAFTESTTEVRDEIEPLAVGQGHPVGRLVPP